MTVSTIIPVNNYEGNSSNKKFDFDFLIEDGNELEVSLIDENGKTYNLKEGIDYSINQIGNKNGSYIIFPIEGSKYDVLKENEKISLALTLNIKQENEFKNSSYFNFEILEWTFDYIVRILQIMNRKIDRSIKVNEGTEILPDELLDNIKNSEHNSNESANNALKSKNEASDSADLSRDWAIKKDGKVQDEEYSSKYYAEKSKESSQFAEEKAQETNDIYINAKEDLLNETKEEINTIKEEAELQRKKIEALGFYQKDGKFYYFNEEGEETPLQFEKTDNLFDLVQKDHILSFEEKEGLERLGEYVYKEAQDGRYGYPDFYNKCLEEYTESELLPMPFKWFKQPILTQNGTIGADSFAVAASTEATNRYAYKSFDGQSNTKWGVNNISSKTGWLTFYNPNPLKVKSITYNASSDFPTEDGGDIKILGSNDNSSWESLYDGNFTGAANAIIEFEINSSKYYKYHKIEITNGKSTWLGLGNITINALEEITIIKTHSNGHKFYDIKDKDKIDEIYSQTGVAWYYGIDEENERILLPRNDFFFQNNKEVGEYIEAGLPNITATWFSGLTIDSEAYGTGAVKGVYATNRNNTYTNEKGGYWDFNASRANPIYGNNITVQPPSVGTAIYIVVGNTTVTKKTIDKVQVTVSENDTIPLFTGQYFDFKPNHASWIKAGTEASGKIYESAYNELLKISKGEETKYGEGFKVISDNQCSTGKDYSEYWIVNEEAQSFKTPLKTSKYGDSDNTGLYFKIGNAVENIALIDAGRVLEALSDKIDAQDVMGCAVPNTLTRQVIELQTSGTRYTAPDAGWVYFRGISTATTQTYIALYTDNGLCMKGVGEGAVTGTTMSAYIPIKKGQQFYANYRSIDTANSSTYLVFFKGEN